LIHPQVWNAKGDNQLSNSFPTNKLHIKQFRAVTCEVDGSIPSQTPKHSSCDNESDSH
jgi:hypothetical protein